MYKIFDWIINHKKITAVIAIFTIFLLILITYLAFFQASNKIVINKELPLQGSAEVFVLNWWVTGENNNTSEAMEEIVTGFQALYPSVEIQIQSKRNDLVFLEEFLANPDSQPDIFTVESKSVPFYQKYSSPNQYFKGELLGDYLDRSVDVIKNNNIFSNEVYGVPLYVDNMQMYVNKNLLSNLQGLKTPAKDWETLKLQAASFDRSKGQSLISLGSGSGVNNNYSDVFSAMMIQNSQYLDSRNRTLDQVKMQNILLDYNFFKGYSADYDNDYDAFKQGKTLYLIDYFTTNNKLKIDNPSLDFEITDIPKYPGGNNLSHAKFYSTMARKQPVSQILNPKTAEPELLQVGVNAVKKKILDDFIYYLSTENVQKIYANKTLMPSTNKKILTEQYKAKAEIDNNRRFFDQASVARAILPACPVKYDETLNLIITSMQSKGSAPTTDQALEVFSTNQSSLVTSVYSQNVCLPHKFVGM